MGKLANAVESYRQWLDEDEERGEVTVTASCAGLGGTEATAQIGRHIVTFDEPRSLGGGSTSPTPVGYLVAALGSCSVIGLSYWSDILQIPYDSVEVVVEGDIHPGGAYGLRDGVGPSFSAMRMEIRISGSEPKDRYEKLVDKIKSHSPLLKTISNPIPVSTSLEITNQ